MPIIVGCPRSGTTLLRFMLDTHPKLAIPPETGFFGIAPQLQREGNELRDEFFESIINFPSGIPSWPVAWSIPVPERPAVEWRGTVAQMLCRSLERILPCCRRSNAGRERDGSNAAVLR